MQTGLDNLGLLDPTFDWRIELLKELLLVLKDIAEKELTNQVITGEDQWYIHNSGDIVLDIVSINKDYPSPEMGGGIYMYEESKDNMAVIVDVHTDPNSDSCLEEAVGYPLEIYVIVKLDTLYVTRGAIFSYYEFTQPISERLTDEEWRDKLQSVWTPYPPIWINSFIDPGEDFVINSTLPYCNEGEGPAVEEKSVSFSSYLFTSPTISKDGINILYYLPKGHSGEITVYDAAGRLIFKSPAQSGLHKVTVGKGLSSGVYFVSLNIGDKTIVRKSVVIQ
jgi:hypothetical protein